MKPQKTYRGRLQALVRQERQLRYELRTRAEKIGMTAAEIAEYQNLSKSGARKFLSRACEDGYVESELVEHGRFGLRLYYLSVKGGA